MHLLFRGRLDRHRTEPEVGDEYMLVVTLPARGATKELRPGGPKGTAGGRTWEDKDEAGSQASDDRDDLADVRDEERQQQGQQEPDQCLQYSPPLLPRHVLFHWSLLVAQPQAFDHRPAQWRGAQSHPC